MEGGIYMKKLEECKEYYKDLYFNCLESNAFDKNIFDSTDLARYEMFCETLKFIYGDNFEAVRPVWSSEAAKEFFT